MNPTMYQAYLHILEEELVPAMGCTEPIAIAYAAALARKTLGRFPAQLAVEASANIIKNVKSVVVPNTGGRKGIETAAAVGVVAGDPSRELEVIASVTPEQREALGRFLETVPIQVRPADTDLVLDVTVTVRGGGHTASVRVANQHTNIVSMVKDGETLFDQDVLYHWSFGYVDIGAPILYNGSTSIYVSLSLNQRSFIDRYLPHILDTGENFDDYKIVVRKL